MKNLALFIKRRLNRRFRLPAAFLFAFFIVLSLLFILPSVVPRYIFTVGERVSILTPKGFKLGQLYDFYGVSHQDGFTQTSEQKELVLPRPDNRQIVFKYPQVVTLGRPTYLGNDIAQSVDFTIKQPPAIGLIQIWVLSSTLDDFLDTSLKFSNTEYLSFESRKGKKDQLSYTVWEYTFKNQNKTIRGLEAFFDDPPYMYRISIFLDDKDYGENVKKVFEEMVKSVTIKP